MSTRRRHQPNPPRFPRRRGMLRVCLVCRDAGQVVTIKKDGKEIQVWRPRSLELVGDKVVSVPDALTKIPVQTRIRLYIHAKEQTPCQLMFAQQSQKAGSSQAG